MQSDNQLALYFEKRIGVLTTHLHNTHQNFNEEDLHQLRVEIKKMRALLRLLDNIIQEDFNKKKFEKILRKLFKPGGKLRESQINISLANVVKLPGINHYQSYLEAKDAVHAEKLKHALNQFVDSQFNVFKKELAKFIDQVNYDLLNSLVLGFLQSEFETVGNLYPEISDPKKLHKVRMHLKASGYIINLAIELWKYHDLQTLYDNVKSIESKIGSWHDKIVFVKSLQRYVNKELSPTEVHVLNSNAETVNEQIKNSFDEIATCLEVLINDNFATFYQKYHK